MCTEFVCARWILCARMWCLKDGWLYVYTWALWVPDSPLRPRLSCFNDPSSLPHILCCSLCFFATCYLGTRADRLQRCLLIFFTYHWWEPSSVQTQTLLCSSTLNTEREEGRCSTASSWINGKKNGTINPLFSLYPVVYRIWWRQSAMYILTSVSFHNFAHSCTFSAYYQAYNESQRRNTLSCSACVYVCVHVLDWVGWWATTFVFLLNLPLWILLS